MSNDDLRRKAATHWSLVDWKTKVLKVDATKAGEAGVMFVWAKDSGNLPRQGLSMSTVSFVVKPIATSGVSTKFAEQMLEDVGNAVSPDSIEVRRGTDAYAGIQYWIEDQAKNNPTVMVGKKRDAYKNAGVFLLQKFMSNFQELSKFYKSSPHAIRRVITDYQLMWNLGMMSAGDLLIGNGDRVQQGNFANIMFDPVTHELASIDSSALLGSFDQQCESMTTTTAFVNFSNNDKDRGVPKLHNYVENLIATGSGAPSKDQVKLGKQSEQDQEKGINTPLPVIPPSHHMKYAQEGGGRELFAYFREAFEAKAKVLDLKYLSANSPPVVMPREEEWSGAGKAFEFGFDEGLKRVDRVLGGNSLFQRLFKNSDWNRIKQEYKAIGYTVEDPNLSWFNLSIRRDIYLQLREGKTMDQAIEHATKLAAKKKGKMLQLGRTG